MANLEERINKKICERLGKYIPKEYQDTWKEIYYEKTWKNESNYSFVEDDKKISNSSGIKGILQKQGELYRNLTGDEITEKFNKKIKPKLFNILKSEEKNLEDITKDPHLIMTRRCFYTKPCNNIAAVFDTIILFLGFVSLPLSIHPIFLPAIFFPTLLLSIWNAFAGVSMSAEDPEEDGTYFIAPLSLASSATFLFSEVKRSKYNNKIENLARKIGTAFYGNTSPEDVVLFNWGSKNKLAKLFYERNGKKIKEVQDILLNKNKEEYKRMMDSLNKLALKELENVKIKESRGFYKFCERIRLDVLSIRKKMESDLLNAVEC